MLYHIGFSGALALSGMRIPGEVYAWVVVFLLPVNSAINPLLYTISAISLMKVRCSCKLIMGFQNYTCIKGNVNLFHC